MYASNSSCITAKFLNTEGLLFREKINRSHRHKSRTIKLSVFQVLCSITSQKFSCYLVKTESGAQMRIRPIV